MADDATALSADAEAEAKRQEEDMRQAEAYASSLFSTKKPKDAMGGVSSALKSVGKGVLMGAVGLVAAPVLGAKEEGVKGFFKGLGAGVIGAVTMPLAGAAVGGYQMVRGLANTPAAMKERKAGKEWDEESRSWITYSLPEEATKLEEIGKLRNSAQLSSDCTSSR